MDQLTMVKWITACDEVYIYLLKNKVFFFSSIYSYIKCQGTSVKQVASCCQEHNIVAL